MSFVISFSLVEVFYYAFYRVKTSTFGVKYIIDIKEVKHLTLQINYNY